MLDPIIVHLRKPAFLNIIVLSLTFVCTLVFVNFVLGHTGSHGSRRYAVAELEDSGRYKGVRASFTTDVPGLNGEDVGDFTQEVIWVDYGCGSAEVGWRVQDGYAAPNPKFYWQWYDPTESCTGDPGEFEVGATPYATYDYEISQLGSGNWQIYINETPMAASGGIYLGSGGANRVIAGGESTIDSPENEMGPTLFTGLEYQDYWDSTWYDWYEWSAIHKDTGYTVIIWKEWDEMLNYGGY